jgi:hypothetical protein
MNDKNPTFQYSIIPAFQIIFSKEIIDSRTDRGKEFFPLSLAEAAGHTEVKANWNKDMKNFLIQPFDLPLRSLRPLAKRAREKGLCLSQSPQGSQS